jgi:hypothetical protein
MSEHAVLGRYQLISGIKSARELMKMFQNVVQVSTSEVLCDRGFPSKDVCENLQRLSEVEQALDGHLHEKRCVLFHPMEQLLSGFFQHDLG